MPLKEMTLTTIEDADKFVERQRNARWEGWDIVTFVPNDRAFVNKRGVYDRTTGRWGFEYRYKVNSHGHWNVKGWVRGAR